MLKLDNTNPTTSGSASGCLFKILNEKVTGGETNNKEKKVKAGRFGNFGSLTELGSAKCPAGHYCPAGSGSEVCVSGTSKSKTGQNCKYQCIDGPNCRVTNDPNSTRCYCPSASPGPTYVSPGYYATGEGDDHYPVETRDSQQRCPASKFCLGGGCGDTTCDGNVQDCPAGRYGSNQGLSSSSCDGPCSAGFFCPAGSRWPTEKICGTIINYCPAGSGAAKVAQPGYYTYCPASSPQGPKCAPATREGELPCPAGYFCSDGGIVNVFWETEDLNSYMCRYVSSANPRIATANAKVVEAEDGAKVLPLLGDASKGEIHQRLREKRIISSRLEYANVG